MPTTHVTSVTHVTHVTSVPGVVNAVTAVPPADSAAAFAHFHASLQFETDCSDVAAALASGTPGFVLLDGSRHMTTEFAAWTSFRTATSCFALKPMTA